MTGDGSQARSTVSILIAVLCAAALLLIVLIVSGSDLDETSAKAIGTASTFAFFYLTAMAGTALSRRRPELAALGQLTVALSVAALVATNAAIWSGDLFSDRWMFAGDAIVLAVLAANVSLLLQRAREEDGDAIRVARGGAIVALSALALMMIVEISSRGRDVGPQPMAVAAVIYLLGVSLLPLLRRLSQPGTVDGPAVEVAQAHIAGDRRVLRLDHTVIAVSDLDRANAFYRGVLGAELLTAPVGRVAYRIGGQQLNVHRPGGQAEPLAAVPVQPGNSDLCFIWDGPIAAAAEHLRRHGVEIVAGPVGRIGAQGPGQSVYFRDPDGSLIELISYG